MPNTKKITKPTWQLNHHEKGKTLKKTSNFPAQSNKNVQVGSKWECTRKVEHMFDRENTNISYTGKSWGDGAILMLGKTPGKKWQRLGSCNRFVDSSAPHISPKVNTFMNIFVVRILNQIFVFHWKHGSWFTFT